MNNQPESPNESQRSQPGSTPQPPSEPSPSNTTPPPGSKPRPKSRQSRLAALTLEQLATLNQWYDDGVSFRDLVAKCFDHFGRIIPKTALQRYFQRNNARNLLGDPAESQSEPGSEIATAAAEISQSAASGNVSLSSSTLRLLEEKAFDLALAYSRDGDADDLSNLADLQRLIHKARATSIRERQAVVQERKCDLREQEFELKKQKQARPKPEAPSTPDGPQRPPAVAPINARYEGNLIPLPVDPSLAPAVEAYTLLRAEEYRQFLADGHVNDRDYYYSKYVNCPCGQSRCGHYGFKPYFYYLSPWEEDYRQAFARRGFPYQDPTNLILAKAAATSG